MSKHLLSKRINNCLNTSQQVLSSIDIHRQTIAKTLAKNYSYMKEEVILEFIQALSQMLKEASDELERAEWIYMRELSDDQPLREKRDRLKQELSRLLKQTRQLLKVIYGRNDLRAFGFEGRLPATPHRLCNFAANVIQLLRNPPKLQVQDSFESNMKPEDFANKLEPICESLQNILYQLREESRELEASFIQRNRALQNWSHKYQHVATTLTSLYELAGASELAKHIKPNHQKKTGRHYTSSSHAASSKNSTKLEKSQSDSSSQ